MTYEDAYKELKEMAKGEAFCLEYSKMEHKTGETEVRIGCWVYHYEWCGNNPTFEIALQRMKKVLLGLTPPDDHQIEEMDNLLIRMAELTAKGKGANP